MTFNSTVRGVQVIPLLSSQQAEILSPEALSFLATLHRTFDPVRRLLLQRRALRQQEIDQGILPHFLPETAAIRKDPTWKAAPPAPGLLDRRVEITGPVGRKMVINALNSGAKTFMADFEDSTAPTWDNVIDGQVNLRDAVARTLTFTHSNGKVYKLREDGRIATLIIRPRGWHLEEKHVVIDGRPCSASLFDFALYFFHNAKKATKIGFGPYFYLPKMESHLEARLWNDVFNLAQDMLAVPRGTIRGTVLIETVLAAFEMDEILFELREHSSGLNCGRWDYIFSFIKKFRQHAKYVLPDRSDISMTAPFMDAYVRLLIQTCHRRGVHAMGGMAAQIPIKDDPVANRVSMDKVRADKQREVTAGHDGTWVAHPDLVKIATEVFDEHMVGPNQLHVRRPDVFVSAGDLLNTNVPGGKITLKGIRANVSVGLTYMESWLRGVGCVPIHHLMEDAATAEISRSQLWQWVRHGARTEEGGVVTAELVLKTLDEEMEDVKKILGEVKFAVSRYEIARKYMAREIVGKEYADFITTLLYDEIAVIPGKSRL